MTLPHPWGDLDAGRLVRSLADHAITFAWLAADPSRERLALWRKEDLIERLKADSDFRAMGEPLLPDREAVQADVDRIPGAPLGVADKAIAADKHWQGRIPGLKGHTAVRPFRDGLALLVAGDRLGWPEAGEVDDVFARFPAA